MVIGIVEDNPIVSRWTAAIVSRAGQIPLIFPSAMEFQHRSGQYSVDALLLSLNQHCEDDFAVLQSLRAGEYHDIPVIFIAANRREQTVIKSICAGTDDCLAKPVRADTLVSRLGRVLRRRYGTLRRIERFGNFEFQSGGRVLTIAGKRVRVTPKEYDLMLFLFRRAERIVSREALLAGVWLVEPTQRTRSIDTYITRLRRQFGLDGGNGWYIETLYRRGYRLVPYADAENDEFEEDHDGEDDAV